MSVVRRQQVCGYGPCHTSACNTKIANLKLCCIGIYKHTYLHILRLYYGWRLLATSR